jgi:hypothetical protein
MALTTSETAPPISASRKRSGETPPSGTWTVASRIADTPASVTSSGPPPTSSAVLMAKTTRTAICHPPVPIPRTNRSAMKIPTATPRASSVARRRC